MFFFCRLDTIERFGARAKRNLERGVGDASSEVVVHKSIREAHHCEAKLMHFKHKLRRAFGTSATELGEFQSWQHQEPQLNAAPMYRTVRLHTECVTRGACSMAF